MRKSHWTVRFALYTVLSLATAWGTLVGFSHYALYTVEISDRTWVPEIQIQQLMQHHGTEVLKITSDAVYILRDSKWIPVLRRGHG